MTHVKLNRKPFEGSLNSIVNDLFTEFPAFLKNEFNQTERKGFIPVNVKEKDGSYQLEVIAPGFEKSDFRISFDDDLLTIAAERTGETAEDSGHGEKEKSIRREYSYSSFKRSFTLDDKIDATKIDASYINGVLALNLPKKEVVKAAATAITIK